MTLVLDTSILIGIEKKDKSLIEKLRLLIGQHPSPAKITFVNYFEFLLGIKKRTPKNKETAVAFLNKFSVLQTTKTTAHILSDLKNKYDEKGTVLSLADLLIASLAVENNMTLATRDNDFSKIEELKKVIL